MPRQSSRKIVMGKEQQNALATDNRPEHIDEDDLCPICHMLLYQPVLTTCGHSLCDFCLSTWADMSLCMQLMELGVDEEEVRFPAGDVIETSCPMCRSLTTASPSEALALRLKTKYPRTYAQREAEALNDEARKDADKVETLSLMIGNTHNIVRIGDETSAHHKHDWKFFVRPSRTDIVEEVHVHLHPTFRAPHIIIQNAPYQVRRVGWGYFTIYASVILKAGWRWMNSAAEDAPDGGERGSLPLQWVLDFNGRGSQKRLKVKIRREKDGQEAEDSAQREAMRRLWIQQRQRDPDYVDEDEAL